MERTRNGQDPYKEKNMKTIDKKSVMNRIINNETVSDIWVLDPNQIERMGYLIFRQVNTNMKLDNIFKDDLIFVIFDKEELK